MFLVVLSCSLSAVFGQALFSIGLTAGDANGGHGYQPLVPQPATYIQPYQTGVVPVSSYPSYPIETGYPASSYGVGYPMPMTYGSYPYSGHPQIYEINRPEGPMRRFWKGAADGVVQGSLGWLG